MSEQTLEDRARLVNRYWPMQYRVASRFILDNWDYEPQEYCPTCGTPEALALRSAPVVAAELRRIAAGMTLVLSDDPRPFDVGYKQRGDEIADWFHRRADELDPPARQEN